MDEAALPNLMFDTGMALRGGQHLLSAKQPPLSFPKQALPSPGAELLVIGN